MGSSRVTWRQIGEPESLENVAALRWRGRGSSSFRVVVWRESHTGMVESQQVRVVQAKGTRQAASIGGPGSQAPGARRPPVSSKTVTLE